MTVRGASVDAQRGVYLVRVSMPALLLPSPPLLPRPSASLRARLMNAVNDALQPLNGNVVEQPITPERVLVALGKI